MNELTLTECSNIRLDDTYIVGYIITTYCQIIRRKLNFLKFTLFY